MIISEQWLREWVNPRETTAELVERLTMAGLEVDHIAPVSKAFSGVVVSEVKSVEPHPDAEKLRVCKVNDGSKIRQVVCGAANVQPGMKAAFAQPGAVLQGDSSTMEIKTTELRGVESAGMLCSAAELGLEERSDGLLPLPPDAPVGMDLRSYLQLDDNSIELDLTPNRGDCLGLLGLAREVGVLTRTDVTAPKIAPVKPSIKDTFAVKILARAECPRYLGRVIRGINTDAETPLWMKEKLRRCGLRSIDPVVDVTNFMLVEMGQPLHAFDLAKLQGGITVRLANPGEQITLLDGQVRKLEEDILVIADDQQAVAMAGIMGGATSAVSDATVDVFLECAYFSPLAVAGKARRYGFHTDASHRYERGVDYAIQQQAIERATALLLEIVGGQAGPVVEAGSQLPPKGQISLRYAAVKRLLGIEIPESEIKEILLRLGMEITAQDKEALTVTPPSFRFDIELEADLIEELARVYGYNRIPKAAGFMPQLWHSSPEGRTPVQRCKLQLVSQGYQEVITYSFIDAALARLIDGPDAELISLENPISSEMAVMRASLWPGLLYSLRYNENRQQTRARLFETGLVFLRDGKNIRQPARIAGLLSGRKYPEIWNNNKELVDFYDLKGDVENLLGQAADAGELSFAPVSHPALHSGQSARVLCRGQELGLMGALHPAVQRQLGLAGPVYLFELDLPAVQLRQVPVVSELSRFPEVSRDLALVLARETPAAEILRTVRQSAGEFLTELRLFDVYQGDAVEKNKKSVALGLTWQHPSRTLSDDEINTIITNCVKALEQQFNANLRT